MLPVVCVGQVRAVSLSLFSIITGAPKMVDIDPMVSMRDVYGSGMCRLKLKVIN